jgi:hypothetical protein
MKTNYLKFTKRLVDPGVTEVHSPPITTEDIHQKFAYNYYFILDNKSRVRGSWEGATYETLWWKVLASRLGC